MEYLTIRSLEQSLEPKQLSEARIRDESETSQERKNVQLARSLLNDGVGGQPRSVRKRGIRENWGPRLLDWKDPPFLEIKEQEYSRRPWLHDYYSRVYKSAESKPTPVPTKKYTLAKRCLPGWSYLPPEHKPSFSPTARARQAEIKRRIVEISGMKYVTAVLATDECSTRRFPEYTRRRHVKRESIRNTETEKLVEEARINLLCERRGDRMYWETTPDSSGFEETFTQPQEDFATTEDAEEYYRAESTITIAEKLGNKG